MDLKKTAYIIGILIAFAAGIFIGTGHGGRRISFPMEAEDGENESAESDHALAAVQWYNTQRAYPSGTIPLGWEARAFSHIAKNNLRLRSSNSPQLSWNSVGPNNLGGRIRSIVVNPLNSSTVYCGSVSGGVWKSTNGGDYWFPLTDQAPNLIVASLALNPVDTNVIYAGTGEGFLNVDALRGIGILKSTDGGSSWTVLNSFPPYPSAGPYYVNKLVITPDNPSVIYAGMTIGLWKSTNAGASWTKVLTGNNSTSCVDLALDPTNSSVLYASFGLRVTDGIYKTTNAGASWKKDTVGFPSSSQKYHRISLAISQSNHLTLYACVADSLDGTHSIQRTTNGGDSWQTVALRQPWDPYLNQTHLGNQGWYDNVIAVHPNDPNTVFTGGNDMFVSTDGGVDWRILTYGYSGGSVPFMHVDQHAIVFDPNNSSVIYFGNDGGVYKSTDGGTTIADDNHNLAVTQFYSGAVHPSAEVYYGGSQDIGVMRSSTVPAWSIPFPGDGGATLVDYTNPTIVYSEYVFLDILKSNSSGDPGSWFKTMTGIPQSGVGISNGAADRCDFIAPIAMDPTNSTHLIAGTYRVYATTNGGSSWTTASGDLTGSGSGNAGDGGGVITALAVAKTSSSTWYVGTGYTFNGYGSGLNPASSTTKIWVTTNSGSRWDSINQSNLPNRFVRAIAVDPTNRDRAFVCYSGYGTGHVFRTNNRGASWSNISSTLPDIPVNALVVDPQDTSHLVIGTDLGVFESLDAGVSWVQQNSGLANVAVIDLDLRPSDLYLFASTHGRGMFKSAAPIGSPNSAHLSLPIHQNPLLTSYVDLYLLSDTALLGTPPFLTVATGSSAPDTVALTPEQSTSQAFRGSYRLNAGGTAVLRASVQNAAGVTMYTQRSFQVQLMQAARGGVISTPEGSAVLSVGAGVLGADTWFTIVREKSDPRGTAVARDAYAFGPAMEYPAPVTVTLGYDDLDPALAGAAHLCICRDDGSGWVPAESWVDPVAHTVSARVTTLGLFAVGAGPAGSSHQMPASYVLSQNYPNPFNPSTSIYFELPRPGQVKLEVFDLTGRMVRTMIDGQRERGGFVAVWDGRDQNNAAVASGVYFYRMTVADGSGVRFQSTRKMLLVK